MKHTVSSNRFQLHPAVAILLAVLLTGGITLFALWIQPNSFRAIVSIFMEQPLLIVLNALPVGLLLLAFSFLFRNLFYGAAAVQLIVSIFSLINRLKLVIRDEPFVPRDFEMAKEGLDSARTFNLHIPWSIVGLILIVTVLFIVLGYFFGSLSFVNDWIVQVSGTVVSLVVLIGLVSGVYSSNTLYNGFHVSNPYYVPVVFNELGFPYCFCHHFSTYQLDVPEGFRKSDAAAFETGDSLEPGADVNVIFVMNEAFSDLSDDPAFNWSKDPLPTLHALQNDPHCISGRIVVPGFAGGTANTEFDVTTGMQTNALSSTSNSAFRCFTRNLDSVFRVFGGDGYHTSFMHPGDAWFYNRENVYGYLGTDEILFAADMPDLTYKGRWATDDSLANLIEDKFTESVSSGERLFNYTTTIQNHMSYTADKYGEDYDYPPLTTDKELSDTARTLLTVYMEGARDADSMLGRLTEYFSQTDEPVVLVYFGDHRPYLGDDLLCYRELDMDVTPFTPGTDGYLNSFETPFVIWGNDSAATTLDWETAAAELDLPASGRLSACYLGATVLELTGRGQETAWFSFLNDLRRQLPVIQNDTYLLADGTVTTELSEEQATLLAKYRQWSYYKMKYKQVD